MTNSSNAPSAIILAAGLSTRMGKPKMLLPWGDATVIEQVVRTVLAGGVKQPVVITGAGHDKLSALLAKYPVRVVFNPLYPNGEMLHSFQAGIAALDPACEAALIVLGDQPQIQLSTVTALILEYGNNPAPLIIPSYKMRRGHPWLAARELWEEILAIQPPKTLRDFLSSQSSRIHYLNVDTPTILSDLDTPEDYQKSHP